MATLPSGAGILLEFIRKTETGKSDAVAYDTIYGHNQGKLPKPLTRMTLDEVIAAGPSWTRAYKSSAAGAYQFMNATLKDLKASEGMTGGETMTPALQDRLGLALLKRRGFDGFMSGTVGLNAFGLGLAREWASFPVLDSVKGAHRTINRGETYYAGDKLNKALVKPEAVEAVLTQVKVAALSPPTSAKPQGKTLMDWLKGLFIKQAVNHVANQLKDTPVMNSNLFHNLLNVAIALLAGVTAFLLATGCSQLVTGALDCSASWIDPVWTTGITAALGLLKTVINIFRDGFGGLFKSQPPVR